MEKIHRNMPVFMQISHLVPTFNYTGKRSITRQATKGSTTKNPP